jgi:hypothetical protein
VAATQATLLDLNTASEAVDGAARYRRHAQTRSSRAVPIGQIELTQKNIIPAATYKENRGEGDRQTAR